MSLKQSLLILNVIFWVLLGSGILGAVLGIRASIRRSRVPDKSSWRNRLSLAGVVSASLAGLLFVVCRGYGIAKEIKLPDQAVGGYQTDDVYLRIGTYLCLAAVILGLGGTGKGRWLAFSGGCFLLILWTWMALPA
jgi:hypothetical protein